MAIRALFFIERRVDGREGELLKFFTGFYDKNVYFIGKNIPHPAPSCQCNKRQTRILSVKTKPHLMPAEWLAGNKPEIGLIAPIRERTSLMVFTFPPRTLRNCGAEDAR
jgi:hypothetical protein